MSEAEGVTMGKGSQDWAITIMNREFIGVCSEGLSFTRLGDWAIPIMIAIHRSF